MAPKLKVDAPNNVTEDYPTVFWQTLLFYLGSALWYGVLLVIEMGFSKMGHLYPIAQFSMYISVLPIGFAYVNYVTL